MDFVIHRFETVASTQDIAKEKALGGAPIGTVVSAAFQTGGRGRRGRGWFAPRGANVCMTVVGPPVALAHAWQVALAVGVAVAEGIHAATDTLLEPALRFPNDILMKGRKVGGVLVETAPGAETGHVIPLIGIGVNINIPEDKFPPELRDKSTSLLRVTGTEYAVDLAQYHILDRLKFRWTMEQQRGFADAVLPRWHALADPDAVRTFILGGEPVLCRVVRIDPDGPVTLETPTGDRHTIPASHVLFGDD